MESSTEFRMKKGARKDKHRGAWEHCLDTTNMTAVKAANEKLSLPIAIMLEKSRRNKTSQIPSLFQKNKIPDLDMGIKNTNLPHNTKITV